MRVSRDLRRKVMAGLFALLAFAPGMILPEAAKAGEGGPSAGEGYAIDQFYDELAPFGDWVYREDHGYVWLPRDVEPEWRPFTVGNWISTEYGWYWESYEPFAWAVYHYGRWGFDAEYGWYWVPGDTWAPAWVQWRYGDEYVGWAPEPPAYDNYAYGAPAQYAPPPPPRESWVFVEPRYLVSPAVRRYALPRTSVSIFFSRSTYVYRPQYRNGHVYNYGMPRDRWSRITRRHIEPRKIHRGQSRKRPAGWNRRQNRGIYAYAPNVKKGAGPRRVPKKVSQRPSRAKPANAQAGRDLQAARGQAQRNRGRDFGARLGAPPYRGGRPGRANRPDWNPHGGQAHSGNQRAGKPYAGKPHPGRPKAGRLKAGKPNGAKAKAARTNAHRHRDMSLGAANHGGGRPGQGYRRGGGKPHDGKPHGAKPDQAHWRGTQPKSHAKAGKPRPGAPKAGNAKAGKPNGARAKAQRHRAMSLGAPTRGAGRPSQAHPPRARPRPNANAGKANANKAKAGRPSNYKASKPKPPRAKAARPAPKKARAPHVRPKAAHAKPRAKPQAARRKSAKPTTHARPKAAHAKPRAKPKAKSKSRAANSKAGKPKAGKPKGAKANRGGGGKRGCKANRNCGRRG